MTQPGQTMHTEGRDIFQQRFADLNRQMGRRKFIAQQP